MGLIRIKAKVWNGSVLVEDEWLVRRDHVAAVRIRPTEYSRHYPNGIRHKEHLEVYLHGVVGHNDHGARPFVLLVDDPPSIDRILDLEGGT